MSELTDKQTTLLKPGIKGLVTANRVNDGWPSIEFAPETLLVHFSR